MFSRNKLFKSKIFIDFKKKQQQQQKHIWSIYNFKCQYIVYVSSLTSQSNPGSSCKSIKEQFGNSASSGLYWIDLQPATQVYCDMDTDGGLWGIF